MCIRDRSMIGNVFNTDQNEAGSFFSFKMVMYVILFGILPSIYIIKTKIIKDSPKKFFTKTGIVLLFAAIMAFVNAANWLWIDKNSKSLGGLAMPWSYSVNTALHFIHDAQKNKKEILLTNATIKDHKKSVVVLVIGESARSENFSLYGYNKNTNPLLSQTPNVYYFNAISCATYTTAGVKCILEHKDLSLIHI